MMLKSASKDIIPSPSYDFFSDPPVALSCTCSNVMVRRVEDMCINNTACRLSVVLRSCETHHTVNRRGSRVDVRECYPEVAESMLENVILRWQS